MGMEAFLAVAVQVVITVVGVMALAREGRTGDGGTDRHAAG